MIEAGTEYHVVVMWDELAVWLVLDGRVLTWSMAHQGGLTGNTDPWEFGRTFWNSTDSDVTIDEVALFDRRLTWPEIDLLSQYVRGIGYDPGAMSDTVVSTVGGIEAAAATAPTTEWAADAHQLGREVEPDRPRSAERRASHFHQRRDHPA